MPPISAGVGTRRPACDGRGGGKVFVGSGARADITITIATIDRGGGREAEYQRPAIDTFVAYLKTITAQLA